VPVGDRILKCVMQCGSNERMRIVDAEHMTNDENNAEHMADVRRLLVLADLVMMSPSRQGQRLQQGPIVPLQAAAVMRPMSRGRGRGSSSGGRGLAGPRARHRALSARTGSDGRGAACGRTAAPWALPPAGRTAAPAPTGCGAAAGNSFRQL